MIPVLPPLPEITTHLPLSHSDYVRASTQLDCQVACIKSVVEVESGSGGFLPSGRPKILFEAHQFSRLTEHAHDNKHPKVSSRKWDQSIYVGGEGEYARLLEAMRLDRNAALQSASWGRFQIMGFNYHSAGFNSVEKFVLAMFYSEGKHLDAFVSFIKSSKLDKALRDMDWVAFARGYNGGAYRKNNYDIKLRSAYEKFRNEH